MPNEVSTPVDLPPFDFQLRGAVYNPLDWYWVMDDGCIYSSARETIGSKMTGTLAVFAFLAPSRRRVRSAATFPTCSGFSSSLIDRATEYQKSRCILPCSSFATGTAETEQ